MSVTVYTTIQRNTVEYLNLQQHRCENLTYISISWSSINDRPPPPPRLNTISDSSVVSWIQTEHLRKLLEQLDLALYGHYIQITYRSLKWRSSKEQFLFQSIDVKDSLAFFWFKGSFDINIHDWKQAHYWACGKIIYFGAAGLQQTTSVYRGRRLVTRKMGEGAWVGEYL
jgi:hypothetical protein